MPLIKLIAYPQPNSLMARNTIVFIHGLWIHSNAWQPWMDFFRQKGYDTINPGWPGDSQTVAESRANPEPIGNHGVQEVADSYASVIGGLPSKPIVIGHSFGGLLAQILLGRNIACAGVALDPAPIKGVWQLPVTALKASFPVLSNPANVKRSVSLTFDQFQYGFANAVSEQEAKALFDKWVIPAPGKPLFQAATATFTGHETQVDTDNENRGPLLITGGDKDHIAPPVLGEASAKKYNKKVTTDFHLFKDKGHSLTIDSGWKEVAEYVAGWLSSKGF